MGAVARVMVVVTWVVGLGLLLNWSDTSAALAVAIAASLITGVLVGRWWVLLVVGLPLAWWVIGSLLPPPDPSAGEDWSGWFYVMALLLGGALGVGIGLRRAWGRFQRRGP